MISFRRLRHHDLSLLYKWLNNSHVKLFWYPDSSFSLEQIRAKYGPRIDQPDIDMHIIQYNSFEIGYIQSYLISDTAPFKQSEPMVGIDLFIGEIDYTKKCIGPLVISTYISNNIQKNIKIIGIDPSVSNKNAIKAYSKIGFKHVNTEYCFEERSNLHYMVFNRT